LIKYKHTLQEARTRAGGDKSKGKESDSLTAVTTPLQALIDVSLSSPHPPSPTPPPLPHLIYLFDFKKIMDQTIKAWMPQVLDADLNKPLEEFAAKDEEEEEEGGEEEKVEKGQVSPYVSPFFMNLSTSPPPCKKHWDLLVDECAGMVTCIPLHLLFFFFF